MKRFYVDTGVWLDFALGRSDGVRPLGELAFRFFKKCIRNKWQVLYSNAIEREIGKKMLREEIEERCFKMISEERLLLRVCYSDRQIAEAESISKRNKIPFLDTLHAVIARDNNAVVVSRNFHFERLFKIVKVCLPEET